MRPTHCRNVGRLTNSLLIKQPVLRSVRVVGLEAVVRQEWDSMLMIYFIIILVCKCACIGIHTTVFVIKNVVVVKGL